MSSFQTLLKLHGIVFLLGFTAILGKLIHIPAIELVWYRMMFAVISIFIFLKYKKIDFKLQRKTLLAVFATGIIVAAHWIFFFNAIKVSNVSVALGCLSVGTLFAGILEPLFERRRASFLELLIGVIIIGAIYLIFQFETRYTLGIIYAIICAFLSSLFTVINRKLTTNNNANTITFYEMLAGFAGVGLYMLATSSFNQYNLNISLYDFIFLTLLGTICTAFAFVAMVEFMKTLSAFTIVLSINLEPVYGILFAFMIFGESEQMTLGFYIGAMILLLCMLGYSYLSKHSKKISGRN